MTKEIKNADADVIRLEISRYFRREEKMNDVIEMHLFELKLSNCQCNIELFHRHDFIGYINYSLIKRLIILFIISELIFYYMTGFQKVAKTKELAAKRIEKYEEDYHCFLELSLVAIHDVFQQCPDLRPNYPAGLPKFTVHLQSDWDGSSALELREFLKHRLDSDCVDNLMVAKITRNCVIITYCVLPHVANRIVKYLTDDCICDTLKMVGITIDISPQLQLYSQNITHDEV